MATPFSTPMIHRWLKPTAALAIVVAALLPTGASAQGGFSGPSAASPAGVLATLFGAVVPAERRDVGVPAAAPVVAYAPPGGDLARTILPGLFPAPGAEPPPATAAAPTAYCVRLCDGRFFPLATTAAVTPAKLCSAFCPASRTKVFEGASIDDALSAEGTRYAGLATAHLYRRELVAGCTCNGKDAFGLAKIDLAADPTLQAGDVVATGGALKVFNGTPGPRHRAAEFTPIRNSALVSDEIRRKLRSLRVAKDVRAPERRL